MSWMGPDELQSISTASRTVMLDLTAHTLLLVYHSHRTESFNNTAPQVALLQWEAFGLDNQNQFQSCAHPSASGSGPPTLVSIKSPVNQFRNRHAETSLALLPKGVLWPQHVY